MNVGHVAKAIIGALIAAVSVLLTAAQNGGIGLYDGLGALLAFLIALGGVYAVPNAKRSSRPAPRRPRGRA